MSPERRFVNDRLFAHRLSRIDRDDFPASDTLE